MHQMYLDIHHFNILFPNVILATPFHRIRNIYGSTARSKLRGVEDRVERSTTGALGYLQ